MKYGNSKIHPQWYIDYRKYLFYICSMIENKHLQILHNRLNLPFKGIENTIKLLNEGATIPFISRYRKELTGSLDEVEVAAIADKYHKLLELEKRKETIINAIEEQGKMTDSLMKRILETYDATELEDIYLPYKKKKKTRAMIAIENGLEPLAKKIMQQAYIDVNKEASAYLNDKVLTIDDALSGAKDIIAEWVNENEQARQKVRYLYNKSAVLVTKMVKGKEVEGSKFKDYFEYSEPLSKCPSHRILAARRGEDEGVLRVSITPNEDPLPVLESLYIKEYNDCGVLVREAIADAYKRLMEPSIENEYRNISKERADKEAIKVFVDNLRQLLLEAPLGQKRVMGIDPGFRTGCKVVCLDNNGDLLHNTTIYPHTAGATNNNSAKDIQHLVHLYAIDAIAVGNGTAGKETVSFLKKISFEDDIDIFMVNESGASIYSASEVAREEFPDYDLTVRGAVSIGRRLMDPLAELIKIDAKSIGVGQYQHDVDQAELRKSLDLTVESCVNKVGVNLNTASKHLLTYISGVGPSLAQNIVNYRTEIGKYTSRKQLKKVPRLGDGAFEQCAGFLRIREAENPLDNTAVHPESYHIVEQMAKDLGTDVKTLIKDRDVRSKIQLKKYVTNKIGMPTLLDIMGELEKPGLDPRGEASPVDFNDQINTMEDLSIGMVLPGIVTNITKFGAFVNIGVKQDGMVHISHIANKFVKDPADVLQLNQKVTVKVMDIDFERKRIQLSMKDV